MALGSHSPCGVVLAENVEQKGLHVIVQSFVVQEQLGQQAQVLAVKFGLGTVHLQPCNSAGTEVQMRQGSVSEACGDVMVDSPARSRAASQTFQAGLQHTSNMTRVGTAAASEWLVRGSGER